jgi:hypothetical protein
MRLSAVTIVTGVLAAGAVSVWWDPTPSYTAVAAEGAALAEAEQLEAVAQQRIFFGHMSVGENILDGLNRVYAAHDVDPPMVLEIAPGESPDLPSDGFLVHALIGENRHPVGKLENFDATLRAGLGEQVDVAALKFCYIDIRWNSDVEALFSRYQDTLSQLESDYPDVQFVHLTVPLTTGPYGIRDHLKIVAGRNDNAARERYNDLMRQSYGEGELFDLAMLEATDPDGVLRAPQLLSGYSSDGAHLNAVGSERLAAELVAHLADGTP